MTASSKKQIAPGSGAEAVDAYIAAQPPAARAALEKMRAIIRSALPKEAVETISYSMPAFKLKKVLVYFAGFKNHTSLFPTAAPIEICKHDLAGYVTRRGTVQFPLDKPLPVALIKKLVRVRLEQI